MKKSKYSSRKRLLFVFAITAFVSIILVTRLGYLQIVRGEELKKGAIEQWTKGITIKSKRGVIYDRKGQKLAVSISASTLWANPGDVKDTDAENTAKEIARVLEMDKDEIYEKITKDSRTERIKQWISREEAIELRELNLPGIQIVDDNRRYYPYENFASYILGFTDIDNIGLYGIEKTYNKYLAGTSGKWIKTTDAPGRQLPFDGEKIYDPADGLSVVLTIDETIQHFAEKAADQAYRENGAKNVSIIVMEPKTGDILAMVSKPDYDPNNPRIPLDDEEKKQWEALPIEELQEKWFDSWRNFAINDIYEPGSTFKLITAAAALEENKVNPDTKFYCSGILNDIRGGPIKCPRAHHDQTFVEAMNNSCNIVLVNVGRNLGKSLFHKYLRAFGFGEKTNIALNGEQNGIIPNDVENIKDINLATMSYGYTVALTPIQLITAVSSFGNGGNLMEPRIVKELVNEEGIVKEQFDPVIKRKVLSEKTASTMLMIMENVVSEGTGSNAYIPGFRVGGKTGTAQKLVDGRYAKGKYIASFVALAPADNPELAILVVIDEPSGGQYYGGTIAAPVAKSILNDSLKYLEVEPQFTEEEKDKMDEIILVPDIRNMKIGEAGKILSDAGLRYTTEYVQVTDESIVINQYPDPYTEINERSIIDIYLKQNEETEAKIPYLVGKTKDEAIQTLEAMNLNYDLIGEGKVVNQNPLPGEKIEDGIKIIVEFEVRE